MPFKLYPRHEQAHEAMGRMLEHKGQAAVIHPTKAGKSYLAFKLIKEHPLDFRILDEYHRCGSDQRRAAVETLPRTHPIAKAPGLSAARIRRLKHHRDMAKELFDNRIASEITLDEAAVRGILPAPEYVTAAYRRQQGLEQDRGKDIQRMRYDNAAKRFFRTSRQPACS